MRKDRPLPHVARLMTGVTFVAGLAFAAWVLSSCGSGKKPYVPDSGDRSSVPQTKGGETGKPSEPPGVEPPAIEQSADVENDRLDMKDRETEAYRIIRAFSVSQRAFLRDVKPSPAVDLDGDGEGEFGFLWEICGLSNLRTPGGKGRNALLDVADWRWFQAKDKNDKYIYWKTPPGEKKPVYFAKQDGYEFLVHKVNHGKVYTINSMGIAERNGYLFSFFLPGRETAQNAGIEVPDGDPDLADAMERRFCAYAWPKVWGVTGRRAFFTCRPEKVWATWNFKAQYSGCDNAPLPQAAYDKAGIAPENLEAEPAVIDPTLETQGLTASDGQTWKVFGEHKGVRRKFEWEWSKSEEIEDFNAEGGEPQRWFEGEEKKRPQKNAVPSSEDQGDEEG